MSRKSGDEPFLNTSGKQITIKEFWQWSASDLLNNVLRGRLAEFIIATALGIDEGTREEWAAYDLKTKNGLTIEVKSASYVQSWFQKKPSSISFSIKETLAWSAETGMFEQDRKHQAQVYIFCIIKEKDNNKVNPIDLSQWQFYILETSILKEVCPSAKSISLKKLETLNPVCVGYNGIQKAIEALEFKLNLSSL